MTSGQWPAIGSETLQWFPSTALAGGLRSLARRASYAAAVPPMIAGILPIVERDAEAVVDDATRELSRFDAELGTRVNSFAPVLLRSESASSSQIENLTASARAIFSAELGAKSGRNAEQIAANTRALQAAIELSEDISADSIAQMHDVLMADQTRHTPGEWREEAVWIGTRSDSPVGAECVAPHQERVPGLIDDLVRFANRIDLPPMVAVALAHAQFETIHPFTDGNGRTGRALAQAMLRERGITRSVAVPVSAGLLADVEGYHAALTAYRAGDIGPILRAFADASLRAVGNARTLVADIDAVRAEWNTRLTVRRDSNAWKLLDILVRRPVLDSATAARELGITQTNAYPPLRALVEVGILKSKSERDRGPFWRADEVLVAIDRFAARAGRREAS